MLTLCIITGDNFKVVHLLRNKEKKKKMLCSKNLVSNSFYVNVNFFPISLVFSYIYFRLK